MMTHQQYNDYSEPSEDDYYDTRDDDRDEEMVNPKQFYEILMKNNIFLENFGDDEYSIRCRDDNDFLLYFKGDYIQIFDTASEQREQHLDFSDAIDYVLNDKDRFLSYGEATKARDREEDIDARDRYNNRAEMGDLGEDTQGYGNDNVVNKMTPEDRAEKLRTQPVYSEEENNKTGSMDIFGRQMPYDDVDASVVLQHYFETKKEYDPEYSFRELLHEIKRAVYNLTELYEG